MFLWFSTRRQTRRPAKRRLLAECLEGRQLFAAHPLGATATDNGEFMLGRVAVTPVLFESDGSIDESTQDWTPQEIDAFLSKLDDGLQWWVDVLSGITDRHELEFVIDPTFALNPSSTPYEPIDRRSNDIDLYAKPFLASQGFSGPTTPLETLVHSFNDSQRQKLGTDWSFTVFVVDSSDDQDGLFASGGSFSGAFAYAGGLFIVVPSERPTSTITHEVGHIFWARDEYPGGASWTERRGYYNTQNWNAANNPTPGFRQEISIMRGGFPLQQAFEAQTSPVSTLAMIGWQDSDGDGVFDLADVPLELNATGSFDPATSRFHLSGSAAAVPFRNANSWGNQSDITLNRVSRIEYSLDEGPWVAALSPDQQVVESFEFSIPVESFNTIRWRAIDDVTGITSAIIEATPLVPAISPASFRGVLFMDESNDGVRDMSEAPFTPTPITVMRQDGTPLFIGDIDAASFGDFDNVQAEGVTLAAETLFGIEAVTTRMSVLAGDQRVFSFYDPQLASLNERWSDSATLIATFDEAVGEVEATFVGLSTTSYGRIEALDSDGNVVARVTSEGIALRESATVRIEDPLGRIRSVRLVGQAKSSVAVNQIRFGTTGQVTSHADGTFRMANLPTGSYQLHIETGNVIYAVSSANTSFEVTEGASDIVSIGIRRIDSPLFNSLLAEDVNDDGSVTAADALSILNDINVNQTRLIGEGEGELVGQWVDVNNDGRVSALDALTVINWININQPLGGGSEGEAMASFSPQHDAATRIQAQDLGDWADPEGRFESSAREAGNSPDRDLVRGVAFASPDAFDDDAGLPSSGDRSSLGSLDRFFSRFESELETETTVKPFLTFAAIFLEP